MARSPTVTIGQATGTGQAVPKVSVGRAYGSTDNGAGAFVIKEITGPDQRTVKLTERALPYKSVSFGITHRIDETDYPGFTQTSQQALGTKYDETDLKGCWKTRFLGAEEARMIDVSQAFNETVDGVEAISVDSNRARTAEQAVRLFEDIARKGQVLRVQWLQVVRIGRIAQFVPTWLTAHDVEWSIKFKWIGADVEPGPPSGIGGSAGIGAGIALARRVSAGYVDLHNKTNLDDIDLDPSFADRIDSSVGRIRRRVLEMEAAAAERVDSTIRPFEALRRVMSLTTFVRDEADLFIAQVDARVGAAITSAPDPGDLTAVSPGRAIQAACAIRQSVRAARTLKHLAARQRYEATRQMEADVIAIELLREGEDCAALSQRYYGTPEEGQRIRLFNHLDSNTAPAGRIILIPALDGAR